MRAVDIIGKKRDGGALSTEEIDWFIRSFTRGEIPDYQAAALLMAIYFRGMSPRETVDLTLAMAHSGDMLDPHGVVSVAVDKHSTGGVGDKTTLVVEPLVAATGLPVGKMSGRGLGSSGGTLDKLESFTGYRVDLTTGEFLRNLKTYGIVLTGQTADLAPADGKLYALRDVTATVPSLPLIASSVMSKKLAAGSDAIVLDVKVGYGAFMRTLDSATALARIMVRIGKDAGRRVVAVVADMHQPLGRAVGNTLEVREAIETLRGDGPDDLREHCLTIGAHMLVLARKARSLGNARRKLENALASGGGLEKLRQLVKAQGGDAGLVDNPERLARARLVHEIVATRGGYLTEVRADHIGMAAVELGAGREKKGDAVDLTVGIVVHHKVGDAVRTGDVLFSVHANDVLRLERALERLGRAVSYSTQPVAPLPLFYKTIR
jgi:pyrimidine-nucleoside phosphorylase